VLLHGAAALCCSSLGFAGTILMRSVEDLQYAQQKGPMNMLAEVGQPWSSEPGGSSM
jgi:ATP adenylyltransferase/5',5'''-P-1,P-4-tetraphosphate phosphorylase II